MPSGCEGLKVMAVVPDCVCADVPSADDMGSSLPWPKVRLPPETCWASNEERVLKGWFFQCCSVQCEMELYREINTSCCPFFAIL